MFWKSTCVNTNVHEQRNHRHPQVHIREPSRRPTCRRSYRQRKEADFVNPRPQNISIIIVSQSPWSISTTRTTTATAKWGRPAKGPRSSRERAPPAAPRERRSVEIRFSLVAPPLCIPPAIFQRHLKRECRCDNLEKYPTKKLGQGSVRPPSPPGLWVEGGR